MSTCHIHRRYATVPLGLYMQWWNVNLLYVGRNMKLMQMLRHISSSLCFNLKDYTSCYLFDALFEST